MVTQHLIRISMYDIRYLLKTAYADSRKNWGKLAMFMSSIVLGMTALVAINSFNYNLVIYPASQIIYFLNYKLLQHKYNYILKTTCTIYI